MLEIKNTQVFGFERSLLAAKNPMSIGEINTIPQDEDLGPTTEDLERGERLGQARQGSGHDNFLSGIDVYYDVKYSMYWSMEFQRYHFNQIISSQSKMHRIISMAKLDDFYSMFNKYVDHETIEWTKHYAIKYNEAENEEDKYYWFMKTISNLPAGFEQWMTIKTNYLQLKTMYNQRRNHKLKDDWGSFCDWCLSLPSFRELTGCDT